MSKNNRTNSLQAELKEIDVDPINGQDIGRIWAKPAAEVPIENIASSINQFFADCLSGIVKILLLNPFVMLILIIVIFVAICFVKPYLSRYTQVIPLYNNDRTSSNYFLRRLRAGRSVATREKLL